MTPMANLPLKEASIFAYSLRPRFFRQMNAGRDLVEIVRD